MQISTAHLNALGGFIEANMVPMLVASIFGFVFLALVTIMQAAQVRQDVRRRAVAFNPASGVRPQSGAGTAASVADHATELLFSVEKGLSATSEAGVSKLRGELIRAGFFGKRAVFWYYRNQTSSGGRSRSISARSGSTTPSPTRTAMSLTMPRLSTALISMRSRKTSKR
jgi:hypothetical protein